MILFQISNSLYLFYVFIFCIIKPTQFAQNTDIKNTKVIRGLVKNWLLDKINNEKWRSEEMNPAKSGKLFEMNPAKSGKLFEMNPAKSGKCVDSLYKM